MAIIDEVIKIAKAELGYHEKATNSQLDDKTANSGSGNYTKYARDLDNVNYFNGKKNGYDWCTVFVTWCHWMALKKDVKKTKTELYHPQDSAYNCAAGCVYAVQYYKNNKAYFSTPKVGDQIFFNWDGDNEEDHTGLVIGVDSNYVYTIEGNTSGGQVAQKQYARNYSCIAGYGRPKYSSTSSNTPTPTPTPSTKNYLSKGDSGADVKDMQTKLIKCGYSCGSWGADGNFGAATEAALKKFQKDYKLTVDGCYGPESKAKLESVYASKTKKSTSYNVKVSIDNLNIRTGPGTNYPTIGKYTGVGVFTIVEESKGQGATKWGRLKSGAGWISLDFATKI